MLQFFTRCWVQNSAIFFTREWVQNSAIFVPTPVKLFVINAYQQLSAIFTSNSVKKKSCAVLNLIDACIQKKSLKMKFFKIPSSLSVFFTQLQSSPVMRMLSSCFKSSTCDLFLKSQYVTFNSTSSHIPTYCVAITL